MKVKVIKEAKSKNELKDRAKKHKKANKKKAWGWFVNPNAGNVEYNVGFFNHVMGSDGGTLGTSGGGMGESLQEAISNNVKIYETEKDGLPEVGRKFIAYRTTHKEYEIYTRQDKEAIRKKGWSDEDSYISKDGEFYSGESGYIYPVDYDRYVYVDELNLISPKTTEQDQLKQENERNRIKTAFNEVFGTLGDKLATIFSTINKKGNVEIRFPFSLRDNALDINYLSFENEYEINKLLIEPMKSNSLNDTDIEKIFNTIFSYNWKNSFTKNKLIKYKQTTLDSISKLKSVEVKESLQKEEDVVYKGFTITHSPTTWHFGDQSYDVDRYIILSNHSLDKEGKHRLPLYCEDENHKVLNFNTLQEAKDWIDKYEGKFSVEVHGDEVHAVINEVSDDKIIEESIEKHDTLNPKIWNSDNTLKKEVKEKIDEIVDTFKENLLEDGVDLKIKDVIICGSNANYNYTENSDIDIHIISDTKDLDCNKKHLPIIYNAYKKMFNDSYGIEFYDTEVEIYVENDKTGVTSGGIYSVKDNKWLKEPSMVEVPEVDEKEFEEELSKWEDECNEILYNLEDIEDSIKNIDTILDELYEMRQDSIQKEGEFSIGNLVFKELRNKGFLTNLKEVKKELQTRLMSLYDNE